MVVSNARKKIGFLHISFYKVVQIVLPIIKLTVTSLLSLLNALADGANKTCKIGTKNLAKLTEEQIAIATNKGWELV